MEEYFSDSEKERRVRKKSCAAATAGLVMLAGLIVASGCSGRMETGSLQRSSEVGRMFEEADTPPEFRYYYYGPEAEPWAVIGIDPEYNLKSRYWIPVNLERRQIEAWNRAIDNQHRFLDSYHGSRILTPEGKEAGIYYSKWQWTVIRLSRPGALEVWVPEPTALEKRGEWNPAVPEIP